MRQKWLLIFPLLFIFAVQSKLFAQDFQVGVGFTIEHPFRSSRGWKIHKIYVPISLRSTRFVPEIAFWNKKSTYGEYVSRFSGLHVGIGVYHLLHLDKTKVYFGPRIAMIRSKTSVPQPSPNTVSSKVDLILGATFGAEYHVLKNLSLGFDIQFNYYEIKPWRTYDRTSIERALESVFVVAFHF